MNQNNLHLLIVVHMLCTSWDFVQVAICTKGLYKLQQQKISCTSCNLYRISLSNKPNLYITVVQVGIKKEFWLRILLKIYLILCI